MSTEQIVILLLIGLAAGFMSSMVGIGGGLVIVPALALLYGMDQKLAQGTSLLIIALPVTAAGAYAYYKSGNANWQVALIIAITFVIGGYFGGLLANRMETTVIRKIFAIFLMLIAIKMLFLDKPKTRVPGSSNSTTEEKSDIRNPQS